MRLMSLLFAGLGMLAGCRSPSESTPLRADVRVQPAEIRVGATVEVTISIANTGTTGAEVVDPRTFCGAHQFRVFDAMAREVEIGLRQEVCTLDLKAPLSLQPGETVQFTYPWRPSTGPGPADEFTDLPPGQYLLRARAYGSGFGELPSGVAGLRITPPE